eukprot:12710353-Alexandrium_andersonii.AAC.1
MPSRLTCPRAPCEQRHESRRPAAATFEVMAVPFCQGAPCVRWSHWRVAPPTSFRNSSVRLVAQMEA